MKFLKNEYDDLMKAIDNEGHEQVQFNFIKKKGMLHVEMRGSASSFCFFRKKETPLTEDLVFGKPDKKFKEKITYFVGPKKNEAKGGWGDVLKEFRGFLSDGVH